MQDEEHQKKKKKKQTEKTPGNVMATLQAEY